MVLADPTHVVVKAIIMIAGDRAAPNRLRADRFRVFGSRTNSDEGHGPRTIHPQRGTGDVHGFAA